MLTQKRASPAGRKKSGKGERKRWPSPRKRQKTDYDPIQEDSASVKEDDKSSEELLHSQEHCIESEERWFSPCGFEEFGGKGTHKKWKNSIIYKNQPLHFWIDRGYLNPSPIKRRTSAASEPSNNKKSHPEESVDKSDHEEEVGPDELAETSEEQPKVQNGEQTKDFTIDIVSMVSQRKPILILHRLEGDFHLLLNNVVLPQNGSRCMPTEEQSEEKIELRQDDSPGPVETSEPQEETLLHHTNNENEWQDEVECMHIEDTVTTKDQAIGTSPEKGIMMNVKNEVEIETSSFQINLELEEEEVDTPLNDIIPDSALQVLNEGSLEDNTVTVLSDLPTTAHTNAEEDVIEEGTPLDVIIPDLALQALIERSPQEDNHVTVLSDPPVTTAHTSAEEDAMDLDELKKEKIKWQIKVLKLQEEYYSLQIQRLKQ